MSVAANLSKQNPLMLAAGVVLVLGVVYWITRKTITEVAGAAQDVATGKTNLLGQSTAGTAYEGAGIFGTLGSTANTLSGGSLQAIGDSSPVAWIADHIGGFLGGSYNDYDPNAAPKKTTPTGSAWSGLDYVP